jgi:hypothetical protein
MGSLGEDGAEEGAWIAIDGIAIGVGGGALLGSDGVSLGFSIGSVCVEIDTE